MNEQDRKLWERGNLLILTPTRNETPEEIRGRHGNACCCSNCGPLRDEEEEEESRNRWWSQR